MEMSNNDFNSRDLRLHRKYILVISFILIFLNVGGVSMEEVDFLGAKFRFENINVIYLGLWGILLYSLIRYFQYFVNDARGPLRSRVVSMKNTFYNSKLSRLIESDLIKKYVPKSDFSDDMLTIVSTPYSHFKRASIFSIKFRTERFRCNVVLPEGGTKQIYGAYEITVNSFAKFWFQWIKFIGAFIFTTPYFFEYYVPFLLPLLVALLGEVSGWEGSLSKLIEASF